MEYGPSFKFVSSVPLVGTGGSSEVTPELAEVMRQNSEAVDEMMATAKQRDSVEALARAIEKQGKFLK